jgi:hypothetical protein
MNTEKEINKNLNRRREFRIVEQADIFYHKIDVNPERKTKLAFNNIAANATDQPLHTNSSSTSPSSINQFLPDSQSQENDTLNVNISSSGISFTCKEELQPGDYLMVRVLLLSGMTVITTCCKVVYSKPSNPFEDDHYPYLVGAQFVNLKQEDKELLDNYVNKKRARQFTINALLASFIIAIIMMPDLALELLLELFSFLFETFIEIAYLLNETIEYTIDHWVEVIFHMEIHNTEITTFYLELALGLALLYPLSRMMFTAIKNYIYRCRVFYFRKKASIQYYWHEQTLWYKAGLTSAGIFLLTCYALFFI